MRKGRSPPSPGCPPHARSQTYPLHPSTSPFSKLLAAVNKVLPFLSPELETRRKGICRPEPSLYGGHEGRLKEAASLAVATVNAEEELGQERAQGALLPPLPPLRSGAALPCQRLEIRPHGRLARQRKGVRCGPYTERQLCLQAAGSISPNPQRPNWRILECPNWGGSAGSH